MKKVFASSRIVACDRARLALAARGVSSELRNEASAALGGLTLPVRGATPSDLAHVELWVRDEDVPEAQAVLAEFADDASEPDTLPPSRGGRKLFIPGFLAGALLTGGALLGHRYWSDTRSGIGVDDLDRDGRTDAWYHYSHGVVSLIEEDLNGDGRIDTRWTYDDGKLCRASSDVDFNGEPDVTTIMSNRLPVSADWHPNGAKTIVRRDHFSGGRVQQAQVDTNADGLFDLTLDYDLVGNVTQTTARTP